MNENIPACNVGTKNKVPLFLPRNRLVRRLPRWAIRLLWKFGLPYEYNGQPYYCLSTRTSPKWPTHCFGCVTDAPSDKCVCATIHLQVKMQVGGGGNFMTTAIPAVP